MGPLLPDLIFFKKEKPELGISATLLWPDPAHGQQLEMSAFCVEGVTPSQR